MSENELQLHYVCTWQQAEDLIKSAPEYLVEKCGCRESKGVCQRSHHDVCLLFSKDASGSSGSAQPIGQEQAMDLVRLSREKLMVARPFRDYATRSLTHGICFCCDDCCGYFIDQDDVCDKGDLIESTEMETCSHCGECVPVCYFGARKMESGEHSVDRDECYGCGICATVCPLDCIEMALRT